MENLKVIVNLQPLWERFSKQNSFKLSFEYCSVGYFLNMKTVWCRRSSVGKTSFAKLYPVSCTFLHHPYATHI